ncbi:hypothetical protein CYMTET_30223 [Cymbomonas tetramitiformis]|uniref:Uncharacterized protein n=1 Tax=Cymbomonas tetramitiformis TaxID=36881 RepID=A0AAE0FJJ5_9CHLO|nr:hypothetical protein CYMTET_30223 [Cymbomonas tetramitiformis]
MPEYAIAKAKAGKGKKGKSSSDDFRRFESLIGSRSTKQLGSAVLQLLLPLTLILHFVEGDSVPPSYILPLYSGLYYSFCNLPESVTDVLEDETLEAAQHVCRQRWLGTSRKVGLRHALHCAVFMLDPYVRSAIRVALGAAYLAHIDGTFTIDQVHAAFQNWNNGKVDSRYARLLSEFEKYQAEEGDYKKKLEGVHVVVKLRIAKVVSRLPDDEKSNQALVILRVLQALSEFGKASTFWKSLPKSTPDRVLFLSMVTDMHAAVNHACGVERVNKNHQLVHTKERASMGEERVMRAVYCYSNLMLDRKPKIPFEQFLESTLPEEEQEELFDSLQFEVAQQNLPASGQAQLRSASDSEEESEDDGGSEDQAAEMDVDDFVVPKGFTLVPKPVGLLQGVEDLRELYAMMLWDHVESRTCIWEVGKVQKFAGRRRRHNYDILWSEGLRGSHLALDKYVNVDDEQHELGDWVYLRKND